MKQYNYPPKETWQSLCQRPILEQEGLQQKVQTILQQVKLKGDKALKELTLKFDGVKLQNFKVTEEELRQCDALVSEELKQAIALAKENITRFHKAQIQTFQKVETTEGVLCWQKNVGIQNVGLYIPGGSAPLFSTVLMLGIPAQLAGCKNIILCTPCNKNDTIHAAILYAAKQVGITQIYKVGGAQAIAAMTFGTETIPNVYKIFGPGNQYVTQAKELAQQYGVAIDMPAGPSEVLVIANETCEPSFVAADLLSQAEHGIDSQVVVLTTNKPIANKIEKEIKLQIETLPRKSIASQALQNSFCVVLNTIEACFEFSNLYAPEHLIVAMQNATNYLDLIENAGSVFVGNYSCESAGDYASGTNHTLPTNGFAKNYSGVTVQSFCKTISYQALSKSGLQNIGAAIEIMAEAEELIAHKQAVTIRLQKIRENDYR
jgi:histidinol dehydrogenase